MVRDSWAFNVEITFLKFDWLHFGAIYKGPVWSSLNWRFFYFVYWVTITCIMFEMRDTLMMIMLLCCCAIVMTNPFQGIM